jgi:hypothetical protein
VAIFLEIFQNVPLTMLLRTFLYIAKWGIFATKNNHCPKYESKKINIILLYSWLPTGICMSNLSHIYHEKSFV